MSGDEPAAVRRQMALFTHPTPASVDDDGLQPQEEGHSRFSSTGRFNAWRIDLNRNSYVGAETVAEALREFLARSQGMNTRHHGGRLEMKTEDQASYSSVLKQRRRRRRRVGESSHVEHRNSYICSS